MIRLGVNIDHIATVRNARGETYPDPVQLAILAELGGAANITCHLREDRRHIKDRDVELLRQSIKVPMNFEIAATDEMVGIACQIKPHAVTLVPEKRQELTTEGGLGSQLYDRSLEKYVAQLKDCGIVVSLFIEPEIGSVHAAAKLGVQAVEFHTGKFCHALHHALTTKSQWALVRELHPPAIAAYKAGIQVHVGHGLHYQNAHWMQTIPYLEEANIGHAIIGRALAIGLKEAVNEMWCLLNDSRHKPKEIW